MVGKSSAAAGPLVFGYFSSAFGNQRPAVMSIAFFFLLALSLSAM
jgi:MFS-type transporter involved in bile tolerance (Atg22 family)